MYSLDGNTSERLSGKTELLVSGSTEVKVQVAVVNGVVKTIAKNTAKPAANIEDKEPPCVVIDKSTIKDLAESELKNTGVLYKRDGRRKSGIYNTAKNSITLVLGGNNCSGNKRRATYEYRRKLRPAQGCRQRKDAARICFKHPAAPKYRRNGETTTSTQV